MAQRLLNKVAVVTGADGGIGRAIAGRFLHEGAKVVLFGGDQAALEEVANITPVRSLTVPGEVTQAGDRQRLTEVTMRRFGRLDVLVPCAEVMRYELFADCSSEEIQDQWQVNVVGAMETVRTFLPHLTGGASILFLTTCFARSGFRGLSIFNAGKAALGSLAQTLSVELASREIRVNCLAPGPTELLKGNQDKLPEDVFKKVVGRFKERALENRVVNSENVAEAAVFLASDAANDVRGQEIFVDGGYSLG